MNTSESGNETWASRVKELSICRWERRSGDIGETGTADEILGRMVSKEGG